MQALIVGAVLVLVGCAVLTAAGVCCLANCQACYWTWSAADLLCGVCGRSRAAASDGREIQSVSEGR